MSSFTFLTVFPIVGPVAFTAGTNPHVHTFPTLRAGVSQAPVILDASQFHAQVLLSDEVLRQQQPMINLKVLHAANESCPADCVGQILLWCPSDIQLPKGAGLEEEEMVVAFILHCAPFCILTCWPLYNQNQLLIHGHSSLVPFSIINWLRVDNLQHPPCLHPSMDKAFH